MAKKYKPKPKTGLEYVNDTKKFTSYILMSLPKFPDGMKYITDPMCQAAIEITNGVTRANAVYIGKELLAEDKAAALKKRVEILSDVKAEIRVFNGWFDKLVDLGFATKSSQKYIERIVVDILKKKGFVEEAGDNAKDRERHFAPDDSVHLSASKIDIRFDTDEIFYTVDGELIRQKLYFTSDNRKHMMELEKKAMDSINDRIARDMAEIKAFTASAKALAVNITN